MRRGFTLIETLIALALGMVVCFTAFACVRACSQAATAATALSNENRLLRAGYLAALDELDYWTAYDDPTDATRQTLRGDGHPFHRLAFTGDLAPITDLSAPEAPWRGLGMRNDPAAHDYARYELVASDDPAATYHRHAQFMEQAYAHLGFFSLFEYAPADTIFSYVDAAGATPETWWRYVGSAGFLGGNDGLSRPKDYIDAAHGGAFIMTLNPGYLAAGVDHARFGFWSWPGWPGAPWGWAGFVDCTDHQAVLPVRPAHWSGVDLVIRHFTAMFRKTASASVTVTSATGGDPIKIAWSMTSTTLRGARRQRDATLGWARSGSPTLDE